MRKAYIKISKFLSFILRHHPEKVDIELDSEGFTDLNYILTLLKERYKNMNLGEITKETMQDLIRQSDKMRFEIVNDKIRALYGHSLDIKITMKEPEHLPEKLYHGTTPKAYMRIRDEGLKSRGRQYVHLTDNLRTAKIVGKRRTSEPVILEIDINAARKSGIKFYKSGDMYLTDNIPPMYIYKTN